jgi:hypothetical protein
LLSLCADEPFACDYIVLKPRDAGGLSPNREAADLEQSIE